MAAEIFLLHGDGELVPMSERAYASEDLLQALLANYPRLIPGEQIDHDDPRQWLLITREASVPSMQDGAGRWAVDHLFLDQDAIPTFVEVKRSGDTRIRREVVGQVLEYAANAVVYWPVQRMRENFETRCHKEGKNADDVLRAVLPIDGEPDEFWQQAHTNLQAGKIRLLFVADEIPTELQRIVEFLNKQMDPAEVLALEIKQFAGNDQRRILVPRVLGQTVTDKQRKGAAGGAGKPWDEESVLAALEEKWGAEIVQVAAKLHAWIVDRGYRVWYGKGGTDGSFGAAIDLGGARRLLPFAVYTYGRVEVQFQHMLPHAPFDAESTRMELLHKLNEIPGVHIGLDAITKRPSIMLATLAQGAAVEPFLRVMDWVPERVGDEN